MKLVKVRNLSQRPATNLSVIVQFLFGKKMPGEFRPGHYYNKGNTVYTISEDGLSIKLWVCNVAGMYPNTKEPYWTEFSLATYINERLTKIIKKLYDPHPQMYNQVQTIGTFIIPKYNASISELEHTDSYMDIFYNGLLVPSKDYEIIDGVIKSLVMPIETSVIIDNYSPIAELSRLIRRISFDVTITEDMTSNIVLPTKKILQYVDYAYDLYINGTYIDPTKYVESISDLGELIITPADDFVLNPGDLCILNCMVSISNNIDIVHSSLTKTITKDMDSYDIDITESGYVNVYQTMAVYIDGRRINDSIFHFSKGFLNIKNKKDYLKKGSVLSISIMSFIPNKYEYIDINHENRRYITESIYTVENNTRLVPIPFIDYNEDLDDFLIFNENGINISSAKWFIDHNYIRYYDHDQGVYIGDTINFKMIDRNLNTIMRTFILTAECENQNNFELPFNSDEYMFEILFYSNGCYLSPNEYTMQGSHLSLTHDMSLEPNDRLEIAVFKYPGEIGSTVMEYHRIFVEEEISNTFKLDFYFDRAVTSFLIFENTGLYVGEKFYEISNDNILTIKGESVYSGGWIDVIVIQSTEALTSSDNILNLL